MKGVVLAGGTATRLGEMTRVNNKHTISVYDRPMIHYPLKALEQAGIKEVCLIAGGNHISQFIELLGDGQVYDRATGQEKILDLDITYRVQARPGGIAEAISLAKNFVGKDRFVVFLGDNIIEGTIQKEVSAFRGQEYEGAWAILKEVENPCAYGVPTFHKNNPFQITQITEKPELPASQYAVTGIYLLDSSAFEFIARQQRSGRGELEVTDLLNLYIKESRLEYGVLAGWWRDAGQSPAELVEISHLIMQTGANKLKL